MTTLSRLLFFVALFGFFSAALLWNSMEGVMLWRVSLALAVIALGIHLLWGRNTVCDEHVLPEDVKRKDSKKSAQAAMLALSMVQLSLVLYAFAPFYFSVGSGIEFIYVIMVSGSGLFLTSLVWLVLDRVFRAYLMDQIIPYIAIAIFFLSSSLSTEEIIYARIFGLGLILLCFWMIYKNGARLKYLMDSKG